MTDELALKDLNQLRLTADDFTVKAIIGRGHFGEVSWLDFIQNHVVFQFLVLCFTFPSAYRGYAIDVTIEIRPFISG